MLFTQGIVIKHYMTIFINWLNIRHHDVPIICSIGSVMVMGWSSGRLSKMVDNYLAQWSARRDTLGVVAYIKTIHVDFDFKIYVVNTLG